MKKYFLGLVGAAFLLSLPALAQNWVGTWAASPMSGPPSLSEGLSLGSKYLAPRQVVHIASEVFDGN